MKKTLVVLYSPKGETRKVASSIYRVLGADLHEIIKKDLINLATSSGNNSQFRILYTIARDKFSSDLRWAYMAIGSSAQYANLVANSNDIHVFIQGMFNDVGLSSELNLKINRVTCSIIIIWIH